MDRRSRHLCVCLTPLHVLTARRIAELRGMPFSAGIYITSADNHKQRHYLEVMREFCATAENVTVPDEDSYGRPKHYSIWRRRLKYRLAFRRFGPLGSIYVPSSNNHYVYMLLSAVHFSELVTFDDGLLNVNPDSPLFRLPTRFRAMIFLLMAGVKYWPERIRARATSHYSLYDLENICTRVRRIQLIGESGRAPALGDEASFMRILVGSAPEAGAEAWRILEAAARQLRLDAYLPHPREKRRLIDGIRYLETPLVAEDYILNELKANPNLAFQIFGYDSTVLINLARTPRIEVFSLLNDAAGTSGLWSLMKKAGVGMLGRVEPVSHEEAIEG
jgi:N-acetyllactosaminide alpha-2,3-sialyltransferase